MEQDAPIPKSFIKEEPKFGEECGEQSEPLMAYPPLPHGIPKEESQLEDGNDNSNSGIQVKYH